MMRSKKMSSRARVGAVALAVLAVTMPLLIAGPADAQNAAGLTLRWAEGFVLLAASLPVLLRDRLQLLALRWKCNIEENDSLPSKTLNRYASVPDKIPSICAMSSPVPRKSRSVWITGNPAPTVASYK